MIVIHISGMPGSGKSTLGDRIARRMKMKSIRVVDTDDLITPDSSIGVELTKLKNDVRYTERWRYLFKEVIMNTIKETTEQFLIFVGILDHWNYGGAPPIEIEKALFKFYLHIPHAQLLKQRYSRYMGLTDDFWQDVSSGKEYISSSLELLEESVKTEKWHRDHDYESISSADSLYKIIKEIVRSKN